MPHRLAGMETVFMGDLHGRRDVLEAALTDLGFMDGSGRWMGGNRRLIQMGDVIDRGAGALDSLDLLIRLQAEAAAAGGSVTCLVGNHEAMALRAAAGDHQYRLWWTLNGGGAGYLEWLRRDGLSGDETALPYPDGFYALFGAEGPYGRWIRTWPVAIRVGEYVAVHGGWPPAGSFDLDEANRSFAAFPLDAAALHVAFGSGFAPFEELLWARRQPQAEIEAACSRLGCRGLIIGHTPAPGITLSHGGRLIQVDTGMLATGAWTALGMDAEERLWALGQGAEPVLLEGDGTVPTPRLDQPSPEPEAPVTPPPQYRAGDMVRLYRAPDGAWSRYFLIQGDALFYGYPAYEGLFLTCQHGGWVAQHRSYIAQRVDRFGRPAGPGEVPENVLEIADHQP